MSVKVMSVVFERYPCGGGERLLALALADHAHDDGTHVFPSVSTLARKSFQSERTVQRQLRKMELQGWLIRVLDSVGGRGNCNHYCINPDWLKGDKLSPFVSCEKGDNRNIKGDIAVSQKGDIAVSPDSSLTISKPSNARETDCSLTPKTGITWNSAEKIFTNIAAEQMQSWEEAFPKLDIDSELTRIELWYDQNPRKRKRDIRRFITNWLSRAFEKTRERKVFVKKPVRTS